MLTSIIFKHVTNARGNFRLDIGIVMREDEYIDGSAADELEAVRQTETKATKARSMLF